VVCAAVLGISCAFIVAHFLFLQAADRQAKIENAKPSQPL
jgi:hypothetical protein